MKMISKRVIYLLLPIITVLLVGCGGSQIKNQGETPSPIITDPVTARNFLLEFLNKKYGLPTPSTSTTWNEEDLLAGNQADSTAIKYTSENLNVVISYPLVAPESILYTVNINQKLYGFSWSGLLDAYGHVTEMSLSISDPTLTTTPTPQPTQTQPPTTTNTPLPSETPSPTQPPRPTPTASQTPDPCNWASFVADVTIPDGTNFPPGTEFVKTWRIKNIGSCTWNSDYDLIFVKGDLMGVAQAVPIPQEVPPGESVDLSVAMSAPPNKGDYRGFWMLRNPEGGWFGLGFSANQAFWVSISVLGSSGNFRYDFGLNFCSAIWRSENGRLSCSQTTNPADGFVRLLEVSPLESGSKNQISLWFHPNENLNGWIDGTYPYFKVNEGDHFRAKVGCLESYEHCNVTFYLDYEAQDGSIYHLGRWEELYDGEITSLDIDLADLAGQTVGFILGMEANTRDVDQAQGFWLLPRIE
jgi:hypothetical protein